MKTYNKFICGICSFLYCLFLSSISYSFIASESTAKMFVADSRASAGYFGYDWGLDNTSQQSITKIGKKQILALVKSLLKDDLPEYLSIEEMKFIDMDSDGILELVISIGDVCVSCPNELGVIKASGDKLIMFVVEDDYVSLCNDIVDINNDGIYEIISKKPLNLASSSSSRYVPWHDIYEWNGQNYILANEQFNRYYIDVYIPFIKNLLNKASSGIDKISEEIIEFGPQESLTDDQKSKFSYKNILKNDILNLNSAIQRAETIN